MTRRKVPGEVYFNELGYPRIRWNHSTKPLVSIITFARHFAELERFLTSVLMKTAYQSFEVIVVCTKSDARKVKAQFPSVHTVEARQQSYSQAYNMGWRASSGEVVVFGDPAIEIVSRNWLTELAGWASQPQIGVVGSQLLSPTGEILHQGIVRGLRGFLLEGARQGSWSAFGHTEWYRDVTAVTGACLAMRKQVFRELGMFDPRVTAPDIDLCLRARRKNLRIVCTPESKLILHDPHIWQAEISSMSHALKTKQRNDPYFNQNLSYDYTIPRLNIA